MTSIATPSLRDRNVLREFQFDPQSGLHLPLWKKLGGDGESFISDDCYGHLVTITGASRTLRGYGFDGIDDKLACGELFNSATTLSMCLWFKPNTTWTIGSGNKVLGLRKYQTSEWFIYLYFETTDGKIKFYNWKEPGSRRNTIALDANGNDITSWTGGRWYFLSCGLTPTSTWIQVNNWARNIESSTWATAASGVFYPVYTGMGGSVGEVFCHTRYVSAFETSKIYLATKWRYE